MTLAEIEILLGQLQDDIKSNTAAIETLNNTVANYATTDDLNTLAKQVNTLITNNSTLQEAVTALDTSVKKIDHLSTLLDVDITNITENDVLQFSHRGKWQNVQPAELKGLVIDVPTGATKLNELSDVQLSSVTHGQFLQYDSQMGYWVNSTVKIDSVDDKLGNYITYDEARKLYLPITGGTLLGPLVVKAMVTVEDNVLVHKALTMYDN